MSNGRIAATGYLIGMAAAFWVNGPFESDSMINTVRFIMVGLAFAAVGVAVFGDRKW